MNDAVISAVAVLLCSSVVRPSPAAKAANRLPSAFDSRWRRSEPNARRMPRLHHVQAPQQQRDAAHQVEKDHGPIAFGSPSRPSVRRHHYRQAGFPESSALLPAINANARTKSPRPSTNLRAHAARAPCQLGDGGGESVEREGDVRVRVGERDVVFALALEDAALAQQGIAALHRRLVAHGGAVVLHLAVREDHVEHRRVADDARLARGRASGSRRSPPSARGRS